MWTALIEAVAPGGSLARAWTPPGQLAPRVTALEIALAGGGRLQVIARRHPGAAREFRLLQRLCATGLPVPRPLALVGDVVATESVDGAVDPRPSPAAMAEILARIHGLGGGDFAWLPPAPGPAPRNRPTLLHGDLWPGNVLWRGGELAAVIDWEDAAWGDPLADLADSRLEMMWARGAAAMRAFTRRYLALVELDCRDLPLFELELARRVEPAIGGWALEPRQLGRMRAQLRWYARQAEAAGAGE